MEEGTLQLSLVAGVRENLSQILPEDSRREVRLPGVNSVRVHFWLDLVTWAVSAVVACWLSGRWCGPGSCSPLFSFPISLLIHSVAPTLIVSCLCFLLLL